MGYLIQRFASGKSGLKNARRAQVADANREASMGSQSDRSFDIMRAGAMVKPILRPLTCIVAVFGVTVVLATVSFPHRANGEIYTLAQPIW